MLHLNRVQLIGRLGEDPVAPAAGSPKVLITDVVTIEQWRDASGERREKRVWHNVEFSDRLADAVLARGYQGARVVIEGPMVTEPFSDAEGVRRRCALIKVKALQFVDPPRAAQAAPTPPHEDASEQPAGADVAQRPQDDSGLQSDVHTAAEAGDVAAPAPAPAQSAAPAPAAPATNTAAAGRRFVRPGSAPRQTAAATLAAPSPAPSPAPAAAPVAPAAVSKAPTPPAPAPAPAPAAAAPAPAAGRHFVRPGARAAATTTPAAPAAPVARQAAAPAPVRSSAPAAAPSPAPAPAAAEPRRTWGRAINRAATAAG